MKKLIVSLAVVVALSTTAYVFADPPGKEAKPGPPACACEGPGGRMMHGPGGMMPGMMHEGMMGPGMGMGHRAMCPMHAASKVEVTKTPKGVTITLSGDDPKTIARIQKLAEIMKLHKELDDQN